MTKRPPELERLLDEIRPCESVLVAFSAGVDSTLVLRAAVDALGPDRVLAVTGRSAAVPPWELEAAPELAVACGARHVFLDTAELDSPEYVANGPDRCYHCKTELFGRLWPLAKAEGLRCVIDGTNLDDRGTYRPGLRARKEQAIVSPLAEAGLRKEMVRELSRWYGLDTAEKPASACLSSRFPYGTPVTPEGLAQVADAEQRMRELGFVQFRVRHHGDLARLEVDPGELDRASRPEVRSVIVRELKAAGYRWVALDLEGYRTGSLNEILSPRISVLTAPAASVDGEPSH